MAVEQYNQAYARLFDIRTKRSETEAELDQAKADLAAGQEMFDRRLAGIYKSGQGAGLLEVILSSQSFGDLLRTFNSVQIVSEHDATLLAGIKKDRRRVRKAKGTLARQEISQNRVAVALDTKRDEIERSLKERRRTLGEVNADIGAQEDELARLAQAQAPVRLQEAPAPAPAPITAPAPAPAATLVPAPAGDRAAQVVSFARAQLGKPYVWAAAGPNSFDCSGLTMYVFAQVGVSLPHSAEAQFNMGTRVSKDQLQPGDLIFGAHGGYIGHVGIYIGNDQYINAPQTGDVVKISILSARWNYVGAVRLLSSALARHFIGFSLLFV